MKNKFLKGTYDAKLALVIIGQWAIQNMFLKLHKKISPALFTVLVPFNIWIEGPV